MSKQIILIAVLTLTGVFANAYSGTSASGSCFSYACKVVVADPVKEEALEVLMGNARISSQLHNAIVHERNELTQQSENASAVSDLTDEDILKIMITK